MRLSIEISRGVVSTGSQFRVLCVCAILVCVWATLLEKNGGEIHPSQGVCYLASYQYTVLTR